MLERVQGGQQVGVFATRRADASRTPAAHFGGRLQSGRRQGATASERHGKALESRGRDRVGEVAGNQLRHDGSDLQSGRQVPVYGNRSWHSATRPDLARFGPDNRRKLVS